MGILRPQMLKCNYHHEGPCAPKCYKCNKYGHIARDCRGMGNANNFNNQKGTGSGQKPTCFECGVQGHFKKECPRMKNNKGNRGNQAGNDRAPAKVYVVGNAGANPDNVVAGTFLLNNRYAYILFDTGADRSFVSTAFSSQINITPYTLDHYYDVELADGRIIGRVGDKVMLKVSPWKGVIRFGKRGKLNPRYVGPFKVLEKVREVAYKLEFPEELSRVHNTFHVSNLKKCHADEPLAVPLDGHNLDDKLHFVEEPVEIVGREVKRLKRSWIPLVKVRWNSKRGPEFTWEREDQFEKKYPHLFTKTASSSSAAS
ncbi:putative reverse transcriptase domain-containing protein [Tanacetum coccineum]